MDDNVLYDHDGIKIEVNSGDVESHDVWIGKGDSGAHFYFGRGILKELSQSDEDHTRSSLEALTQGTIGYALNDSGKSLDTLRVAISQARIKELENEIGSYLRNMPPKKMDENTYLKGLVLEDIEKDYKNSSTGIDKLIMGPCETCNVGGCEITGLGENQAVVEAHYSYSSRAGGGLMYILEKLAGNWKIKEKQITWIS